ncbi:MAG: flagellar basal body rod C-terminal domain-containing protein [Christensenella sp.]|uniref:flagellar basal body rod C-terminal domain-containing protein n=1 Tax=Christensenella sp. TaxID=1935934 RepID=UPI002B219B19|nr:flagellar basal body rod C-terminal domain-containing protein [Christensenella sp.]MEA5004549.1 flagellar basal body rod C-terminal domain-containing protein [Christensenella sp.]
MSNNRYAASAASGQPAAADTGIIQKALEGSNVDLASEFSSLIRASRAMQLASRALTTADEMDGTAISTRR